MSAGDGKNYRAIYGRPKWALIFIAPDALIAKMRRKRTPQRCFAHHKGVRIRKARRIGLSQVSAETFHRHYLYFTMSVKPPYPELCVEVVEGGYLREVGKGQPIGCRSGKPVALVTVVVADVLEPAFLLEPLMSTPLSRRCFMSEFNVLDIRYS